METDDQIIAQVNDLVILKSDIDTDVRTYILQNRVADIFSLVNLSVQLLENYENLILLKKQKLFCHHT